MNEYEFSPNELNKYRDQFGSRSLTDKEHEKIIELKKQLEAMAPYDELLEE